MGSSPYREYIFIKGLRFNPGGIGLKKEINVNIENITNIAIEGWKLSKLQLENDQNRMVVKKFLKHFNSFLAENQIEIIDLTGQVYEPGMAVEVIFTEGKDREYIQTETIIETIRPIIIINDQIAKHGQVVTKKTDKGG